MKEIFLVFVLFTAFIYGTQTESNRYQSDAFFGLRVDEGKGVGYQYGYATEELLLLPYIKEIGYPFIDLRFHQFYDNTIAFNLGIGGRLFVNSFCGVLGLNLYYDFRNCHHANYNQIGIGGELSGTCWVVRLNGYFPIGDKKHLICSNRQSDGGFFIEKEVFETAFTGTNLEIGARIGTECSGISLFGGPYFFKGKMCKNVIGGEICAEYLWNWLRVNISSTCDNVFHARIQGEISLTIPLGRCPSEKILPQRIRRNEIIVLNKDCRWKWNY